LVGRPFQNLLGPFKRFMLIVDLEMAVFPLQQSVATGYPAHCS
jgi:hypothetical protein